MVQSLQLQSRQSGGRRGVKGGFIHFVLWKDPANCFVSFASRNDNLLEKCSTVEAGPVRFMERCLPPYTSMQRRTVHQYAHESLCEVRTAALQATRESLHFQSPV